MRRVVVTGLGLLSPFGVGAEHGWKELLSGKSAARHIDQFETGDLPCKIAMPIPRDMAVEGAFDPDRFMEPKEQRKVGDFILYGVAAAELALADSGWKPTTPDEQNATGVMIGSGIGGIQGIAETEIYFVSDRTGWCDRGNRGCRRSRRNRIRRRDGRKRRDRRKRRKRRSRYR